MLSKPLQLNIEPTNSLMYVFLDDYDVNFAEMLASLQFTITKGTLTDLASVPWYFRFFIDREELGYVAPPIYD